LLELIEYHYKRNYPNEEEMKKRLVSVFYLKALAFTECGETNAATESLRQINTMKVLAKRWNIYSKLMDLTEIIQGKVLRTYAQYKEAMNSRSPIPSTSPKTQNSLVNVQHPPAQYPARQHEKEKNGILATIAHGVSSLLGGGDSNGNNGSNTLAVPLDYDSVSRDTDAATSSDGYTLKNEKPNSLERVPYGSAASQAPRPLEEYIKSNFYYYYL
jgi:hypothetical protein